MPDHDGDSSDSGSDLSTFDDILHKTSQSLGPKIKTSTVEDILETLMDDEGADCSELTQPEADESLEQGISLLI